MVHIYNINSKTDGWKAVASDPDVRKITVIHPVRKDKIDEVKIQHFFVKGKGGCDKYPTEPTDAFFYNDPRGFCSDCLVAARAKTAEALAALTANDESVNVIDYKAAEKQDHPESATTEHEAVAVVK